MRRLCVALILLAAVGCGGSSSPPASPSPSTASPIALTDFSGLWTGTYTFTTCTGERHCDLRIGTSQDFGLRLEQAGSRVHGLFTWSDFAAEISGDVRDDGSVTLSGEAPKASEKDWGMTVSRIALRLSPERALQGTIAYQTHPGLNLAEFAGSMAAEGQIGSTRREDLRAFVATVDGTWNGRFAIRGCTPPGGAPFCNPHEDQETAAVELIAASQRRRADRYVRRRHPPRACHRPDSRQLDLAVGRDRCARKRQCRRVYASPGSTAPSIRSAA